MYYIYELWSTHPQANKTYIGQTINPYRRFKHHTGTGNFSYSMPNIKEAIKKYGYDTFYMEILDCTDHYGTALALERETMKDRGWENLWNKDPVKGKKKWFKENKEFQIQRAREGAAERNKHYQSRKELITRFNITYKAMKRWWDPHPNPQQNKKFALQYHTLKSTLNAINAHYPETLEIIRVKAVGKGLTDCLIQKIIRHTLPQEESD